MMTVGSSHRRLGQTGRRSSTDSRPQHCHCGIEAYITPTSKLFAFSRSLYTEWHQAVKMVVKVERRSTNDVATLIPNALAHATALFPQQYFLLC
jgi:hypothetical protein